MFFSDNATSLSSHHQTAFLFILHFSRTLGKHMAEYVWPQTQGSIPRTEDPLLNTLE